MAATKRVKLVPVGLTGKNMLATVTGAVAAEIRGELARRLISQREVAVALGVAPMYLSRRMRGETAFDIEEIAAIAQLLDCPIADLLPAPGSYGDPVANVRSRAAVRRQGLEPRTRWLRDYAPVFRLPNAA